MPSKSSSNQVNVSSKSQQKQQSQIIQSQQGLPKLELLLRSKDPFDAHSQQDRRRINEEYRDFAVDIQVPANACVLLGLLDGQKQPILNFFVNTVSK